METFYWKPYFWSRSYMLLTTGGAPIEVIRTKRIKRSKLQKANLH
ncbi:transposase [Bacillus paramycoides]